MFDGKRNRNILKDVDALVDGNKQLVKESKKLEHEIAKAEFEKLRMLTTVLEISGGKSLTVEYEHGDCYIELMPIKNKDGDSK